MAQQMITEQGAFTADAADKINDNFTELFGSGSGDVAGPASAVSGNIASFDGTTGKVLQDGGKLAANLVTGPPSVIAGTPAVYSGTSGKVIASVGTLATAGPFTTITSITVVNGLVTDLQGS